MYNIFTLPDLESEKKSLLELLDPVNPLPLAPLRVRRLLVVVRVVDGPRLRALEILLGGVLGWKMASSL